MNMNCIHTLAHKIDHISVSHLAFHHRNIAQEFISSQRLDADDNQRLLCEAVYHLSCLAYQARTHAHLANVLVTEWALMPCQSRQMLCWLNQLRSAIRHYPHSVNNTPNFYPAPPIAR
ncbi:hypothetical protein [Shewanella aestuarii]|uniref:Uncharacterized protein n=1 Tax=Shewanella aestuarii TaxID=1028752 RepID=A0A6G9QPF7_9GAMM|nr:hypothetical protein [Shewanella aestuarii]QIR16474.1 hypothetical protein HBH39_18555 [Shewanella aestuarii]